MKRSNHEHRVHRDARRRKGGAVFVGPPLLWIALLAALLLSGCAGTSSKRKSAGRPTTDRRITFSRASLKGSSESPVVGVAPFSAKSGWNKTRLKDLELEKRLTRELRRKLLEIGAIPESIPASVLGTGKRRRTRHQRELTDKELDLLCQLNYGVTGSVDALEEAPSKVMLSVTYEVYRGGQQSPTLSLILKQTVRRESGHGASPASLRSAAHRLVGIVAARIALKVCPKIRKRSQGAVRG